MNIIDHGLYARVRDLACQRKPTLTWEQIAETVGAPGADELITWFMSYRLPPPLAALERVGAPRNPDLRIELQRLRDREASLLTVCSQAPIELATIQRRIASLERAN
jgi:hypothetical protein